MSDQTQRIDAIDSGHDAMAPPKPRTPRVVGVDDLIRELHLFNHHKAAEMMALLASSLQWQEDERCSLVRRARNAENALDDAIENGTAPIPCNVCGERAALGRCFEHLDWSKRT